MNGPANFHSLRLAVAGYGTLALLAWIAFVPGGVPPVFSGHHRESAIAIVVTAAISLFIIVILVPVFWFGPWRNRWLAGLLFVFPLLVFSFTGLWLISWAIVMYRV